MSLKTTPLFREEMPTGPLGVQYAPDGARITADGSIAYHHPERATTCVEGVPVSIWNTLADNEDSKGRTPYDRQCGR